MKRWGKGARWGIFVLVLAALIAMAFFYIQHQKQVADPKNNCSMLQSPDEVSQALANHEDLTHRFEGMGGEGRRYLKLLRVMGRKRSSLSRMFLMLRRILLSGCLRTVLIMVLLLSWSRKINSSIGFGTQIMSS